MTLWAVFYEIVPLALQVMVIVFSIVLKGMPKLYFFAVIFPSDLFPLFVAVAEVIFHVSFKIEYVILEEVQVAELPL